MHNTRLDCPFNVISAPLNSEMCFICFSIWFWTDDTFQNLASVNDILLFQTSISCIHICEVCWTVLYKQHDAPESKASLFKLLLLLFYKSLSSGGFDLSGVRCYLTKHKQGHCTHHITMPVFRCNNTSLWLVPWMWQPSLTWREGFLLQHLHIHTGL